LEAELDILFKTKQTTHTDKVIEVRFPSLPFLPFDWLNSELGIEPVAVCSPDIYGVMYWHSSCFCFLPSLVWLVLLIIIAIA
jgi:hypothetical protein